MTIWIITWNCREEKLEQSSGTCLSRLVSPRLISPYIPNGISKVMPLWLLSHVKPNHCTYHFSLSSLTLPFSLAPDARWLPLQTSPRSQDCRSQLFKRQQNATSAVFFHSCLARIMIEHQRLWAILFVPAVLVKSFRNAFMRWTRRNKTHGSTLYGSTRLILSTVNLRWLMWIGGISSSTLLRASWRRPVKDVSLTCNWIALRYFYPSWHSSTTWSTSECE